MRGRLHYLLVFAPLVSIAACTSILGDFSVGGGDDDGAGDSGNLGDGTTSGDGSGDGAGGDGSTITDGATGDAADGGIKCGFPGEACCAGPFSPCNDGLACVTGKCRVSDLWTTGEINFISSTGYSAHYDGTSWKAAAPITLATTAKESNPFITGLWSYGVDSVETTTSAGFLMSYLGGASPRWRTCSPTDAPCAYPTEANRLFSIFAFSSSDVWILGTDVVDHCTGAGCIPTMTGLAAPPFGETQLTGTSSTDMWLPAFDHVSHYDGTSWTSTPSIPASTMWAYTKTDVWTASGSTLKHFDGVSWSPNYAIALPDGGPPGSIYALWGTATDDVWAVGYGGSGNIPFTEHWNGTNWTFFPIDPAAGQIDDVWAIARDEAYIAGGFSSIIYKWNGTAWAAMTMPPASSFTDSGFGSPAWERVRGSARIRQPE